MMFSRLLFHCSAPRPLLAVLLVAAAGVGCHRGSSTPTIAVIPKGTSNVYWESVHAGAEAAGKASHYQILWNGPELETEYDRQASMVEDAVNRGVSGIVLAPAHREALVPAVRKAIEAHVPVTIFDSGIALPPSDYVSYVATNNEAGGAMAADRVGDILHGSGKVAIVGVAAGSVSTTQREDGFSHELAAKFPGIHILDLRYGQADVARSRAVAEDLLTAHPDLDCLFASNESSTAGTLQALKGRGLIGKVKLVGFDAGPLLVQGLRAGEIDSLVVQDPYEIGYQGVMTIVTKLSGQVPPSRIDTPAHLVTRANMDEPAIQKVLLPPVVQ